MIKDQKNFSKYILLFSGLLILIISYLGYKNPVLSYELSIYNSTPMIIWVLYIIVLLFLYFVSIFMINNKTSKKIIHLLIYVSLMAHFIFLTLPYIRGYYTLGGDHITHSFIVKNLLLNGHIELTNIYPISHIFATTLALFTNIDYNLIINISSTIFSLFFILSLFCLGKLIISDQRTQIIGFITSTCIFITDYQIFFMPNGFSILYLPLIIYLFFRSIIHDKKEDWILFILNIYLLIKFHPVSSLFVNIYFVIFIGVVYFAHQNFKNQIFGYNKIKNVINIICFNIILFVVEFIFYTQYFYGNIRLIFLEFFGLTPNLYGLSANEKLTKMGFTLIDTIRYIIITHGQNLILGFLSFLCFVLVYQNKLSLALTRKYISYILLGSIFLFGSLYSLAGLGLVPGSSGLDLIRLLPYSMIFAPIFTGIIISYYSNNRVKKIITIVILLSASTISIINIFPSPYTYQPNPLTMKSEVIGCIYIKNYKIPETSTMILSDSPDRIFTGILNQTDLFYFNLNYFNQVPDHFGYNINSTLSSLKQEGFYLYYIKEDYILYNTVYSPVGRYLYSDFNKLNNDINVNKCYTNNNVVFMFIN